MPLSLQPLPLPVGSNLVSRDGDSTYIKFINHLNITVRVDWIDQAGQEVFYTNIEPGQSHRQHTFVGHPWKITSENGFKAFYLPTAVEAEAAIEVPNLTPLPSEVGSSLRSIQGPPTVVNFINLLEHPAKVLWIDYDGARIEYTTLEPGGTHTQKTYFGHPWEITAFPDFKRIYLPIETESNVRLEDLWESSIVSA